MASTRKPAAKRKATKVAQSMPIDPKKHKEVNKGAKIYNKGKSTDNPNERDMFLKRTGPQLPLAKRSTKKKYA
jgi:hypothetical protein